MSVTFISPTDAWALGYAGCASASCTTILHSTDGTRTWTRIAAPDAAVSLPSPARSGHIAILRFATAQDGWAAGGALYATHDGGSSWQQQSLGGTVVSVETGGGYVYAETYNNRTNAPKVRVYAARIGSNDWRRVSGALVGTPSYLVVSGADWYLGLGHVWHGSGFASATNRGSSPCPTNKGYAGNPYLAISSANSLDAVCSGNGAAGSESFLVYGSNNGARSWRRNGPAQREEDGPFGVADNAHGVLLIAVASGGSDIVRSTDVGENLASTHPTGIGGGFEWTDLGFTTPTQAVAVLGHEAMYLSGDAGRSWHRVHFR